MGEVGSLRRDAFIILAVGIALGLAHNLAGLASRPSRGLPWVASSGSLPSLTGVVPPDSGDAAAASDTIGAPSGGLVDRARPEAPAPTRASGRVEPPAGAHSVVTSPHAEPPTRSTGDGAVRTAPAIPDLDHPVEVDLATAKRLFDSGAALFLDARDPPEYLAGHIPGALRLTRNDALAEPERLRELPVRGRPIVTYCEGGECEASADLARTLSESGFRRVLVLPGGMPEWAAAGFPVEKGEGKP